MSSSDPNVPSEAAGLPATPLPGARAALALLLCINLFNYIDRQVLAAVVPNVRAEFFRAQGEISDHTANGPAIEKFPVWFQHAFGFKPENALIGMLSMAFMVIYMVAAPVFGRLAERTSRWLLIGIGVVLWSLASGASGLAGTFLALLITRCFVGIGEADLHHRQEALPTGKDASFATAFRLCGDGLVDAVRGHEVEAGREHTTLLRRQ
jgi:MFS family permease